MSKKIVHVVYGCSLIQSVEPFGQTLVEPGYPHVSVKKIEVVNTKKWFQFMITRTTLDSDEQLHAYTKMTLIKVREIYINPIRFSATLIFLGSIFDGKYMRL